MLPHCATAISKARLSGDSADRVSSWAMTVLS
jgi:hypothetical protein